MKKIWWIGVWVMGNPMVVNLLAAWYEVNVYNRTAKKAQNLIEKWAQLRSTILELVNASDIVITIIWDPKSVEEVYFWEAWIFSAELTGKTLIDMTTTEPSLATKIYNTAKVHNCNSLDAPVSWGDVGAQSGTLSIMVGGDEQIFTEILPLFGILWKSITYTWWAWNGQHTKMANQISIAGNTIALCESLVYAQKVWLDIEKTIQVVSAGAAWNWWWTNLAPRIQIWELDTCFYIKHFVKDMRIALDECQKMNIVLPWLALVHQLYTALISQWDQELWTQALIKILRKLNNLPES